MKFIVTIVCSAFLIALIQSQAASQNLLQNGGFEKHGSLDCLTCPMWPEKFAAILPQWQFMNGSYPFICDCQHRGDKLDVDEGICPFDMVMPNHGKNMMEMSYLPSCYDQEMKTQGCSSYLGTQLSASLEIGKVYEISFWLFLLPSKDSAYANHIGFNLYSDILRNPKGKMLEGSKFLVDTVIYNRWYQVKWLVRPVCNLRFLVLGVFRGGNNLPINNRGHRNRFYIDDVCVIPKEGITDSAQYVTPYCKYCEQEKKDISIEIAGTTCFFETNDSLLSSAAMILLDSFAIRAKNNPLTAFTISGNTDDIGSNHQELSKARVKSALNYLEKKHKIQPFRFYQIYLGNTNPIASNDVESSRKSNRRIDIRQTDGLDNVLYRNLLLSVFNGEKDKAFQLLAIWLSVTSYQKKIYLLFDPRLEILKSDRRWEPIAIKKVKALYSTQKSPKMAFLLDSLGKEDQKNRTLKYYIENLNAYLEVIDSIEKRFDVAFCSDSILEISALRDEARSKSLSAIIGKDDWPAISDIGERPAKCAFLILSHGDSTNIAHYLPLIKQRCKEGEAAWIYYAMLFDRLQVMRGLPQHFGTQYKPPKYPEETLELFPLESSDKVDQWRQEIGIEALKNMH